MTTLESGINWVWPWPPKKSAPEKAPGGQAPKAGNREVGEGWDLGRKLRSQGLHRAKQLGVSKIHSTRVSVFVVFFNMITPITHVSMWKGGWQCFSLLGQSCFFDGIAA